MRMIVVKPKNPDVVVFDHAGRPIPKDGKPVVKTPYIVRRMNDGDLVEVVENARPTTKKGGTK